MSDQSETQPFQNQLQNGIFDMLMALVREYQIKGMSSEAAVGMACDWLISLGNHVKDKAKEVAKENEEKQNQIFPS